MTVLLTFLLPLTAHMKEYKIPQSFVDSYNVRMEFRNNVVSKTLNYNVLSHIPVSSPIYMTDIRRVSDLFGPRKRHPVLNIPSFHSGIDFSANVGTPVLSTANGSVVDIKYSNYGYGNKIVIEHDNTYQTIYAHLHDVHVNKGDTVIVGQEIGTVGNSGLSTGSHLHYEIRHNGHAIDPLSLYQIDLEKEDTAKQYLAFLSDFESVIDFNS